MPNEASGKKTTINNKSYTDNLSELFDGVPTGGSMGNNASAKADPPKYTGKYRTGPGGNVVVNKPLTSLEWNDYATKLGWEKVTGGYPTTYASYKIPGKSYEIIKNGKKVRIPYETYTMPTKDVPAVNPTIKPLDFNNRIGVYDPKTGMYTDPMTGKIIPTEAQSFPEAMKKGGMVKGYEVGGGIPYAGNVQKTTPTRPVVLNSGATMSSGSNVQKAASKQPTPNQPAPTTTGSKQRANVFSVDSQNAASAGLAALTSGLGEASSSQEMQYGSNAYFDKMKKTRQNEAAGSAALAAGIGTVNPLLGQFASAAPSIAQSISEEDAYGVSDKGDSSIISAGLVSSGDVSQRLKKSREQFGKGNFKGGVGYITPGVGNLMLNDERKYERDKLKFENEQNKYNKDIQDKQAYNIQEALAMRNEGIANYTSDDFIKDPMSKKNEFVAPKKSDFLASRGLAKGGAVKGGTIKGDGTGTSDSINAQVMENSFVVPAKNNKVAKTLREMMLGDDPESTAKTKQGMGPKVKLSNGEHLFTPAERAKLEAKGVNLYDLAPKAEDSDKYSMGGYMKKRMMGYATGGDATEDDFAIEDDFVKREQAKIDAERIRNEKVMSRQQAQLIAEKKTADLRYKKYQERQDIYKGLENQSAARKKADEDYKNSVAEYETLKKGYTEFVKSADEAKKQRPTAGQQLIGNQTTFAPDYEKEKQKRLAMVQEAKGKVDKSKRQLEFTSSEKNFVGDLAPKKPGTGLNYLQGDMPTQGYRPMTEANTATTTPAAAKKGASGTTTAAGKKAAEPVYNPMMNDTFDPIAFANANPGEIPEGGLPASTPVAPSPASLAEASVALKPGVKAMEPIDPNNPLVTANEQAVTNSNVANPTGAKFSWQDGLGAAINYGLPLAQSIIGFNQLQKIGDRPVDKLDQDLVNAYDTTRGNAMKADLAARYGMSAEELAALRMQNAALTNTGRYNARNFSGGSGANALNMERSVINDSFDRALQAKIVDKNLQMQKQQNAYAAQNSVNSLAQYKQEANRRLFQDDLTAFKEKTDAASGLMATGLSNLSDAAAADKRMREFRKMNSK
jgi:hypothetical protein